MSERIFVSYSHHDAAWRTRLADLIGGGVYLERFELWFDTEIEASDNWKQRIAAAIAGSRVALLLLSPQFLRSDFIANRELPEFLRRHKAGGMSIFWVPLEPIENGLLDLAGLGGIQAAQPLCDPLSSLDEEKRKAAILAVASKLINHIDLIRRTPRGLLDELTDRVDRTLREANANTKDLEPIASGDFAIFFKARQRDDDVSIKALVPSPNRGWLAQDYVKRAKVVRRIENSTAITIRDVIDAPPVHCVVTDYVQAPTLKALLDRDGTLPGEVVVEVLAQLVRLAGHVHAMEGGHLVGPVRPSHVHYDAVLKKAFISLIPIANETLEQCRNQPTRLIDSRALPYLSPELYFGKPLEPATDQYYLGLLALELLEGKLPVAINTFADLKRKVRFFRSPAKCFGGDLRQRHPAMSFVLGRMLDGHPQRRWPSMVALESALRDISAGRVPDAIKDFVDDQYREQLSRGTFFASFYRRFMAMRGIAEAFERRGVDMMEQPRKLQDAMGSILNYNSGLRTSTLESHVRLHRGLPIKPEHFSHFKMAFLEALPEAGITDERSQDAWSAVLDPALDYMTRQVCGDRC
jgi:hemoglobin-like flavoprotein